MSGLKLFFLTLVLFGYLLLGAVVFHFLESDNESVVRVNLMDVRQRILDNYTCLDEGTLEMFVQTVVQAHSSGIVVFGNQSSPSNWDFSSAFFFSGTVVTTIGYGSIAPKTYYGQLMCMVYAFLGIPFTAWVLSSIGNSYQKSFERYMGKADRGLKNLAATRKVRKILLWILVIGLSYTAFLIVPSLIFVYLEEWSFHIAHYYSFITLTTIGFGDYIATVSGSTTAHWVYDIMVTMWNIFGLAYLATLITVIRQGEKKTAQSFRKFHARVIKRHKMLKGSGAKKGEKGSASISESNDEEIKDMFVENGMAVEARYSKRHSAEGVDLIVPCYVKSEVKHPHDAEDGEVRELMIKQRTLEDDSQDEGDDELIVIEGKIVEEGENMCIMLECERGDDAETAGRAIQAALQKDSITTDLRIPHGSYAHHPPHALHHRTVAMCTQSTQTGEDT